MNQGSLVTTFDEAVRDYLASLSPARQGELTELFINSMASWAWYVEVIDRYRLRDPDSAIVADIDLLHPDEAALKLLESDFSGPVWEAAMILAEAKRRLRNP